MPSIVTSRMKRKELQDGSVDPDTTPAKRARELRWEKTPTNDDDDANVTANDTAKDSLDDDDDDSSQETCMSITGHSGRVAAAYYDSDSRVLHLMEDTQDSSHFDLTQMLFEKYRPGFLITSSRADESLIRQCQLYSDESCNHFQVRPNREFASEQGRDRLLSLAFFSSYSHSGHSGASSSASESMSENGISRNAYDFMSSHRTSQVNPTLAKWAASMRALNFGGANSSLCLSAVGALLEHLLRIDAAQNLASEGIGGLDIVDVRLMEFNHAMTINDDALISLQVFGREGHASIHSNRTKEGLSLFGILDHTRTKGGRSLLRQWLLRPSLDPEIIASRHDALSCFLLADNLATIDSIKSHLSGINGALHTFAALRSGYGSIREWTAVVKFTFHATLLRKAIGELGCAAHLAIVEKMVAVLDTIAFKEIGALVNGTIDWEASMAEGHVCVRFNVDPELDEKKRIYDSLSVFLAKVALRIAEGVPSDCCTDLNVVYFPQLGYLITVPLRQQWQEHYETNMPGWAFQFSTNEQIYFKNQDMHDLDLHIGDLRNIISDREIEIIQTLQERVLVYNATILATCDASAELDCLLSLAIASYKYDFKRPQITNDTTLVIQEGRHPLQELCEPGFKRNGIEIFGGYGSGILEENASEELEDELEKAVSGATKRKRSVLICTGPNACGKSVYLKQTALICILAQIGCFVPAERAIIGIVDKVFTRIQSRESVAKAQSAFMIDVAQVSLALRNCTERSLIILDEFGKGTVPADGAGLLCGVLKHLLDRGAECPRVLVATHFHEIFRQNLLQVSLPIMFVHMEVIANGDGIDLDHPCINEENNEDITRGKPLFEQFTFLFSVILGLNLDSHAAYCALLNGIPNRTVKRAKHVSDAIASHNVAALLDERLTDKEIQNLAEAELITRRFCTMDLGKCENIKQRLVQVLGDVE